MRRWRLKYSNARRTVKCCFGPSARYLPGGQGPCGSAENVEIPLPGLSGVLKLVDYYRAECAQRRAGDAAGNDRCDAWGNGNVLQTLGDVCRRLAYAQSEDVGTRKERAL